MRHKLALTANLAARPHRGPESKAKDFRTKVRATLRSSYSNYYRPGPAYALIVLPSYSLGAACISWLDNTCLDMYMLWSASFLPQA